MALIVQKYGGTSVGSPERIKNVARRVAQAKDAGNRVVVVVSAMGDTTDDLIKLAYQVSEQPDKVKLDALLGKGATLTVELAEGKKRFIHGLIVSTAFASLATPNVGTTTLALVTQ